MRLTKEQKLVYGSLFLLFIVVAGLRIFLAYDQPLPAYDSYEHLRQVEHIRETGIPLFDDDLSFSGRNRLFSPLYYYVLAALSFILPKLWLVKVVPNVFAAAIVFPAYYFSRLLTRKTVLSIVTAGLAGLVPSLFLVSLNDGSSVGLTITLLFSAAVLFLNAKRSNKQLRWFLFVIVFLIILQPLSIIFLLALVLYVVILQLHRVKVSSKSLELLLFIIFFMAWLYLIIYKQAFVYHGINIIWQNIPLAEVEAIFSQMTLLQAISSTGLVTLVLGAVGLYEGMLHTRKKPLVFLVSLGVVSLLLLWFKFIPLQVGLAVFGVTFAIASGYALLLMQSSIEKTKAPAVSWWAITGVIALFILVSVPTVLTTSQPSTPREADIEVLSWARERVSHESIILASPLEGNMITMVANRKNVIDNEYVLIPRVEERYEDVLKLYKAFFKTDALSLMEKYGVTHVYVSPQTKVFSGVTIPTYLVDDPCFVLVKSSSDESVLLYERVCSLRGDDD